MIDDGKSISIANLGGLYRGRTIRFSPLMDGGLDVDEDHAFTVNGDGNPQLLQFDNDCATIAEQDGSIVRLDVRNYRMTILPYHVRFNDSAVDSDGAVVRNYMMAMRTLSVFMIIVMIIWNLNQKDRPLQGQCIKTK